MCDSPAAMLTKKPCAAAAAVYPTGKEPNDRFWECDAGLVYSPDWIEEMDYLSDLNAP